MSEENKVLSGKVAWFSSQKGFGFISRGDGQKDIFVHYSNIAMEGYRTLEEGQEVAFEIGANHKGEQAVNVKILSAPAAKTNE